MRSSNAVEAMLEKLEGALFATIAALRQLDRMATGGSAADVKALRARVEGARDNAVGAVRMVRGTPGGDGPSIRLRPA